MLFGWSEWRGGRLAADVPLTVPPPAATAFALVPTAVALVPSAVGDAATRLGGELSARATDGPRTPEPVRTPSPTATRPAAPTPARPLTATSPPAPAGPREVSITLEELDGELQKSLGGGGMPLRNPRLRFVPTDRVVLTGDVPLAIFQVPVEIEARLSVEGGQVKVTTSKVEAVGASLPGDMTRSIGQRIDDQGTRAVADALPPGAVARRVIVDADRIRVELG